MSNRKKVIDLLVGNVARPEPPVPHRPREEIVMFATGMTTINLIDVQSTKKIQLGKVGARKSVDLPYTVPVLTSAYAASVRLPVSQTGRAVSFGEGTQTTISMWGQSYWKDRFSEGGNVRIVPIPLKVSIAGAEGEWMPDETGQRAMAVPNFISIGFYRDKTGDPYRREGVVYSAKYFLGIDTKELGESAWSSTADKEGRYPGLGDAIRAMANQAWNAVIQAFKAAGMGDNLIEEASNRLRRAGFDVDKIMGLSKAYFLLQLAANVQAHAPVIVEAAGSTKESFMAAAPKVRQAVSTLTTTAYNALEKAARETLAFARGLIGTSVRMALSILGTGSFTLDLGTGGSITVTHNVANSGLATISENSITVQPGIWLNEVDEGGWISGKITITDPQTRESFTIALNTPWDEHAWDALMTNLSKLADDVLNAVDLMRDFPPDAFVKVLNDRLADKKIAIALPAWDPKTQGLNEYISSVTNKIETSNLPQELKKQAKDILARWAYEVGGHFLNMGVTNIKELDKRFAEALKSLRTNQYYAHLVAIQPNVHNLLMSLTSRLSSVYGFPPELPTYTPTIPTPFRPETEGPLGQMPEPI